MWRLSKTYLLAIPLVVILLLIPNQSVHNNSYSGAQQMHVDLPQLIPSSVVMVDSARDVSYEEGTTGHNIVWRVRLQPPFTLLYQIHILDVSFQNGTLEEEFLVVNVDGLSPMAYIFILTISDGNDTQTDNVRVTVYTKLSSPPPPPVIDSWLPGIAVTLLISSIVLIEYLRKRKVH